MSKQIWAVEPNFLITYLEKINNIKTEDIQAAMSMYGDDEPNDILSMQGDTARISINGILSKNGPSQLDKMFGYDGTGYKAILLTIETIKANPQIKIVILEINSPGGEANGVDDVYSALVDLKKQCMVIAENHGLMASAAYWIASAANEIVAMNPAVETGSIGVVVSALDFTKMMDRIGIKRYSIVSKNAPNKVANVSTPEGRDIIQERVDALERVFMSRVAAGRCVSLAEVRDKFGRGCVYIAQDPDSTKMDAVKCGMVDRISDGKCLAGNYTNEVMASGEPMAATPAFKDYEIVDQIWDSAAADERIRNKIGAKDKPNAAYADVHFWYDPQNKENFGGYKLPFCDVVNGKIVAIRKGIFAADGAMHGARGNTPNIPESDRASVQGHIDRYKEKIKQIDNKKLNGGTKMNALETLIAEDASAKALFDAKLEEKYKAGLDAGKAEMKVKIDKAVPFLIAESYPNAIKTLAGKVLTGESEPAALEGAVVVFDMQKEAEASQEASGEVAKDVNPDHKVPVVAEDGVITSDTDLDVAMKRLGF